MLDENPDRCECRHLLKGHAVQNHLCPGSNVLHCCHINTHAKAIQKLRPQLSLLIPHRNNQSARAYARHAS